MPDATTPPIAAAQAAAVTPPDIGGEKRCALPAHGSPKTPGPWSPSCADAVPIGMVAE